MYDDVNYRYAWKPSLINVLLHQVTKSEHIEYWKRMAMRDWQTVLALQAARQNMQSFFFVHLVIEKLLKAHFVKDNQENTPPLTHQ